MLNYKLTNKAVDDLTNIWNYSYSKWSESQANTYYHLLISSFQDIAKNPDLGKNYENVKPNIFGYKINRHIIFYRKYTNQSIEITRILHERMDLKNRIQD